MEHIRKKMQVKKIRKVRTIEGKKVIHSITIFIVILFFVCFVFWSRENLNYKSNAKDLIYQLQTIKEGIHVTTYKNTIESSFPILGVTQKAEKQSVIAGDSQPSMTEFLTGINLNHPISIINEIMPVFSMVQVKNIQVTANQPNLNNKIVSDIQLQVNPNYKNTESSIEEIIEDENKVPEKTGEQLKRPIPDQTIVSSNRKIQVRNLSGLSFDIKTQVNKPLKIKKITRGYQVLILHSHTGEAYLKDYSEKSYLEGRNRAYRNWKGNNVVKAGEELTTYLKTKYGLNVLHLTKINDQPYTQSYGNSRKLVIEALKQHPEISVVIDLHRDAMVDLKNAKGEFLPWKEQLKFSRPIEKIDGKDVAKFFCVVSTNKRLSHPHWMENLNFGLKLHQKGEELYPGLMGMLQVHEWRYNQDLSPNYLIVEIGSNGNTIEDVENAVTYLGNILGEVLRKGNQ